MGRNIFGIYQKKVNFRFTFSVTCKRKKKLDFFHSYFSLILLSVARLEDMIWVYNVILMTG